jgi:anaerobic ribonucleoside-triphosphate reductase activating protein
VSRTQLSVADLHPACRVLGPGTRYVVWVQGCPLSCPDCVSPQWIPFAGGSPIDVDELAEAVVTRAVDGLTLSGGEPFAHAEPLLRLVRAVRRRRDLSMMSYSGFPIEHLRARGSTAQRALLHELDILVDGPYVRGRHAALRWRGSANQRVHVLTPRHADLDPADDCAGLQFEVTAAGDLHWMGVPPTRGFRDALEDAVGLGGAAQTDFRMIEEQDR